MKCSNYPNIFPKLLGWHVYCCLDIQFLLVALQPRELTLRTVADSGSIQQQFTSGSQDLGGHKGKNRQKPGFSSTVPKIFKSLPTTQLRALTSVVSACEHAACAVLFPQFWLVILSLCNCKLLCSYFDKAKDKDNPFLD